MRGGEGGNERRGGDERGERGNERGGLVVFIPHLQKKFKAMFVCNTRNNRKRGKGLDTSEWFFFFGAVRETFRCIIIQMGEYYVVWYHISSTFRGWDDITLQEGRGVSFFFPLRLFHSLPLCIGFFWCSEKKKPLPFCWCIIIRMVEYYIFSTALACRRKRYQFLFLKVLSLLTVNPVR